jgi:hypothetical protein
MYKLRPSALSIKPRWETIELADGQSFRVELTPPDRETFVYEWASRKPGEKALMRFACITNWHGMVQAAPGPDGPESGCIELPFSDQALDALLRQDPTVFNKLLVAIAPLFDGLPETTLGESQTPPVPPPPETTATDPEAA